MSKTDRWCVIFPALGPSAILAEILGPGENPDHVSIRLARGRVMDWPEDQLNEYETAEQAEARLRDLREIDRKTRRWA